jgi:two-component system, NarL family, response regulator LiaR
MQIRVMVVDDHSIVRRGLEMFLAGFDDLCLVGEAGSGEDAIRVCGEVQPHVILMDMMLPGIDGVATTRAIRAQYPQVQVVMLTSSKEEHQIQAALSAGAIGYMLKNVSVHEMSETIRAAYAGKPMLASEAAQALINLTIQANSTARASQPADPLHTLTERERDILALIVDGLNNQEIADRLFVSRSTIKNYISTLFSKLGVENRIEAVRLAMQHALVK